MKKPWGEIVADAVIEKFGSLDLSENGLYDIASLVKLVEEKTPKIDDESSADEARAQIDEYLNELRGKGGLDNLLTPAVELGQQLARSRKL